MNTYMTEVSTMDVGIVRAGDGTTILLKPDRDADGEFLNVYCGGDDAHFKGAELCPHLLELERAQGDPGGARLKVVPRT